LHPSLGHDAWLPPSASSCILSGASSPAKDRCMLHNGIGSTSSFTSKTIIALAASSFVLFSAVAVGFSLLFPCSAGHSQASSSSIAVGTASGSRAQVHSKQHTSSSGRAPAEADVTNSIDGKTAMVSSRIASASGNSP